MRWLAEPDRGAARLAAAALALLLFFLPFHLLVKRLVPGPLGTYWKDLVVLGLAGLVVVWLLYHLIVRRPHLRGLRPDLISAAVLVFAALVVLRGLTSADRTLAFWGLYLGFGFLPVYFAVAWLVPAGDAGWKSPFNRPELRHLAYGTVDLDPPFSQLALRRIAFGLVAVAVLVALGGALEFVLDRSFVPSEEIYERSGYYAVYVFGTNIRRVYFTFDAPTALGHFLTLVLPIGVALLVRPPGLRYFVAASDGGSWRAALRQLTGDGGQYLRLLLIAVLVLLAFALAATFSRAAWVGAVAGLLTLLGGALVTRDRRFALAGLAGFAIVAIGWGLVSMVAGQKEQPPRQTVEIPADRFAEVWSGVEAASMGATVQPVAATGAVRVPDAPTAAWSVDGDTRTVLLSEPPPAGDGQIVYEWASFPGQSFLFSVALNPENWRAGLGDGVRLSAVAEADGAAQTVFTRHLNPKSNPADRKWRNFETDLSAYEGRPLRLSLRVDPETDASFDQVGWAEPRVASAVIAGELRSSDRAITQEQLGSLGNWDEDSNSDRVAAWLASRDLWQSAPIWGTGLGTTGAATFREGNERGFVTESQVLKVLVEMGIIGFLSYAAIVLAAAWTAWMTLRRPLSAVQRTIVLGVAAALVATFVDGLVLQNLEIKQVQAAFWFLLGTLAVFGARTAGKPAA